MFLGFGVDDSICVWEICIEHLYQLWVSLLGFLKNKFIQPYNNECFREGSIFEEVFIKEVRGEDLFIRVVKIIVGFLNLRGEIFGEVWGWRVRRMGSFGGNFEWMMMSEKANVFLMQ